jgi:hypothetical protein
VKRRGQSRILMIRIGGRDEDCAAYAIFSPEANLPLSSHLRII